MNLVMVTQAAWSSDACSEQAILTSADVSVSDGTSFRTRSYFQSREINAIRHIRDTDQVIAVEGPQAWVRVGHKSERGAEFHKVFSLGHQFHAFLLNFEEIGTNFRHEQEINFAGGVRRATSADLPYGGAVHMVAGDDAAHPVGFLLEVPDSSPISVYFRDWRNVGERELPFLVKIDDGERVFDYRFTEIDLTTRSPLWFFEELEAPTIDPVQIFRLHRKILAAHCLGDAKLMADLSAARIIVAGRGELTQVSNADILGRFTSVFERLDYTNYFDIVTPLIEVSDASDLGWIAANVRAIGADRETGESFDDQWAWVMMVKKVSGEWLHFGNASNRLQ
jgi:hypothetical protein